MIVKHNLSPAKVVAYIWRPLGFAVAVAVVAVVLRHRPGPLGSHGDQVVLPFVPIGTLGAALAIFVAFRNNAAYARWWEARTVWSTVHSLCRVLVRQVVAATDNAIATGSGGSPEEVLDYRREVALRVVAFAHALRIELRRRPDEAPDWSALTSLLPEEEYARVAAAANAPNLVLQQLAVRVKDGVRAGMVGQFDPISLEPTLVGLNTATAACERIKDTPPPRQYDYFTRVSVAAFSLVFPFGLLQLVPQRQDWAVLVLTAVVVGVFVVLERVGTVVEAPFAGTTTDVPLTYVTNRIERDVREQLGETDLPEPVVAVDGYLW